MKVHFSRSILAGGYLLFFLLPAVFFPGKALPDTVPLPLSVDYPLLQSLVIRSAFTDPGHSAELIDEVNGCWRIRISEPLFLPKDGYLHFQTKIDAHAAAYVLNRCVMPIDWQGYLVLVQEPKINNNWIVSFDTKGSFLLDRNRVPAKLAGIVWNLVKTSVYDYLSHITINLSPPVEDLKSFLHPLFPPELGTRSERLIQTMRPGKVSPARDALRIDILTEVEDFYRKEADRKDERLTESEIEEFVQTWETWDAFLVFLITSFAEAPLTDADRQILLDVLLETRYRFIEGLTTDTLGGDFVREQFVSAWRQLSDIFRRHVGGDPSKNLLGYLALFTALDALAALDRIGPTLGIEISRNGLVRLIRMIGEEDPAILFYRIGVDTKLRKVLGLGLAPLASAPRYDKAGKRLWVQTAHYLLPSAFAGQAPGRVDLKELEKWILRDSDNEPYLLRVKSLLEDAARRTLKINGLPPPLHDLFSRMVFSIAWQESCFRQFHKREGKLTYLLSYNGTSVGLMQINERVWRGIYDRDHLRWNITYNGLAGCEIIDMYFQRYALKKLDARKLPNHSVLAALTYAMYNGGPGQFDQYLERKKTGDLYSTDKLFAEKFHWISRDRWEQVRTCFPPR